MGTNQKGGEMHITQKRLRCFTAIRIFLPFEICRGTVKSGIIVLGINIVTSPLAFLAGPILVNMKDVDVLQKNLDFK